MTRAAHSRRAGRQAVPRRGDEREQRLLDVAEQILDREGFDAMTVGAVASAAGLTRPAFYFYFDSKGGLLAALVERATADLLEPVRDIDADDPDFWRRALEHTVEIWRVHGAVLRAAVENASAVPAVQAMWNRVVDEFVAVAAERIRRQDPSLAEQAPRVARALTWMVERTFYDLSARRVGRRGRAEMTETLLLLIERAVNLHCTPAPADGRSGRDSV